MLGRPGGWLNEPWETSGAANRRASDQGTSARGSDGGPPRAVERQRSRAGAVTSMNDERPILEVRQSAWQLSSVRDQRLRIFGDRVELVRPKVTSEARTTAIPFADIDYISVKPFLMVWFDLVIVPKSGAAIRLRPLARVMRSTPKT